MLKINTQKEVKKIVQFIKKALKDSGFKRCIISLSGGIDSSACLVLLTKAINPKNVLVLKLAYGNQNMNDADKIIKLCKVPKKNIIDINIKPIVEKIVSTTNHQPPTTNHLRKGNIMARTRMIISYDLAKAKKALVCGTSNKSEIMLGYFTLHGDSACDLAPLAHLYKTQVRQLAKSLGVPKSIIKKPPTAGLWPGQTDEAELGFSYEKADKILSSQQRRLKSANTKNLVIAKFISSISEKQGSSPKAKVLISRQRRLQPKADQPLAEKSANTKLVANTKVVKKVLKRVEDNKFKQVLPFSLSS